MEDYLVEGIKAVGVGRKGSRSMDEGLTHQITNDLRDLPLDASSAVGAFLGALFIKGVADSEKEILSVLPSGAENNPVILIDWLAPNVDDAIRALCRRLIRKEELSRSEAETLGDFLFSKDDGNILRGLVASILRVRYETPEEYEGIANSLAKTFMPEFQNNIPDGKAIIQMAEPFDGVDHSYIITPLVAQYLQTQDYRVVCQCAPSPGPKNIYNLFNVAQELKANFIQSNSELIDNGEVNFGYYLNQEQLSPALKRWIGIRREIVKRPFLSTLERFVNPCQADVLIVSAFHPPYGEKMLTIAERAGFEKIIVVRNGLEGSIAFPLKRAAKILLSRKNMDGQYVRSGFEFWPEKEYNVAIDVEEKYNPPVLEENVRLIKDYQKNGTTDNERFDLRVRATCEGIAKALSILDA